MVKKFLGAVIHFHGGAETHCSTARTWVENQCKMFGFDGGPWDALAGEVSAQEPFSYEGFIQELEHALQAENGNADAKGPGPVDTYDYQQFLRKTRDRVAAWIGEQRVCDLFAADMKEAERQWREYRGEWQGITDEEKDFRETGEGREWYDEVERRRAKGQYAERISDDEIEWFEERRDLREPRPKPGTGERRRLPKALRGRLPDCPLDKWRLYASEPLTINDYRFLLGVVHDGVTWHERDKRRYICRELAIGGTSIVHLLFWDHVWYGPRYQPLVQEALDIVERDIEKQGQDGTQTDTVATAAAIIANLKTLCRKPPEHTALGPDEHCGAFSGTIGGEQFEFFGRDGWLWYGQTREPAGRRLGVGDEIEAEIEGLLRWLRLNGFGELDQSLQDVWKDIKEKTVTVVYSETRPEKNLLVRLQHELEIVVRALSRASLRSRSSETQDKQGRGNKPPDEVEINFTDTEANILEALGNEHMTGPRLLKKAGYDYSSHYRQILSNLVKRGVLGNDHTGYYRIR
jgi:hypothetical protein